jgi:hypothetical protein
MRAEHSRGIEGKDQRERVNRRWDAALSSHGVRTTVAGGAATLWEQATGQRLSFSFFAFFFRPAEGG